MIAPLVSTFVVLALSSSYTGTVKFAGAQPSGLTVLLTPASALVTLGPGHVALAETRVTRANGVIRFVAPGLPQNIRFAVRSKGALLAGTATQGVARGTVSLHRGTSPDTQLGYFTAAQGELEVARFTRYGYDTQPLAIDSHTGVFGPVPAARERLDVHQFDVRFRSGNATLAGTLTLPAGTAPFPAVVYVSGSGDTLREESHWLDGLFVSHGVAVLAYDKRGVGQSGGAYPGSLASESTIATLAGDAVAAARFLRTQAGIDPAKVGFYGISQGGWIIPQAAVRAGSAISWAVIESGPTVTQGESDTFASLAATMSLARADAQARAFASGYDPRPWIEKLAIPVLWLYGGQDRNQPTAHSREILHALAPEHAFTDALFPDAAHPLFDRSGFASGVFPTILDWLGSSGPFAHS